MLQQQPVGMPDVQKLRAVLAHDSRPHGFPVQGHVGLFDPDRRLNFVLADFETDASARFRKGIDGGLNILTGPYHHRATARRELCERREHGPAIVNVSVGFDDREMTIMVIQPERRRQIETFDIGIRRPGRETPVIAALRCPPCLDRQSRLHPILQQETGIGCRQFDQPVGGEVQVDQLRSVGFAHYPGLIPPDHAQMFRRIGHSLGEIGDRQGRGEGQCLVGVIHRHLAHLTRQAGELASITGQFHPVAGLEPQHIVAPQAFHAHGCPAGHDFDQGGRHMRILTRPFHLGGRVRRTVHFDAIQVVLQATVPARRRHETRVWLRGDGNRGGRQPRGRGAISRRPTGNILQGRVTIDLRRNAAQYPDLPGGLVPGGRIHVHCRLDKVRRLQIGDFPAPHV